jgi:peptidoglycan/LPS O-acetylase OafA/YrhL
MALPSYRPLTQHDHKFAILAMILGAAWFSMVAASNHQSPTLETAHISLLVTISPFLPFFGGFLWLVLDSWHHGRAWWQLLLWSGSGSGVSQLLGFTGLTPIAFDMWVSTIAVAVIVFKTGFKGERGIDREKSLATSDADISRLSKAGQA